MIQQAEVVKNANRACKKKQCFRIPTKMTNELVKYDNKRMRYIGKTTKRRNNKQTLKEKFIKKQNKYYHLN